MTYCYTKLTASFINFFHYCPPSSGLYGTGKDNRGRRTVNPSGLSVPQTSSPIFTLNALSAAMLPIYPGLGQSPNNAGLHTQWLGLLQA